MRPHLPLRTILLTVALAAGVAATAAADVTVITHYTLIGGDTLTRMNYYSSKRVRVTAPDGKEFMFNRKGDSLTVIDHATRRYWTGPRKLADSVASRLMAANRQGWTEVAAADPVAWGERVKAFNDSIHMESTFRTRKIAGYPADEWILTAGSYLRNERWIAQGLSVPNYGPEMQKAVMSTIKDPLGRVLMRMLINARTKSGMVMASYASFRTLQHEGSFGFEAQKVISGPIPKAAWMVPDGYTPITL